MADISTVNSTTTTTLDDSSINPNSNLGKDDFMKLLLTELQHQDPTSPMESDKILSQTSQLAALETQDKTNSALEELTASFANNKNFSAVSAIGKYARLDNTLALTFDTDGNPNPINFKLQFDEDIESGTVKIYDENNYLVKTIDVEPGSSGTQSFKWDGTNSAGEPADGGSYTVIAEYINQDGVSLNGEFESKKIESVKFDGAQTYVKLGGTFVSFEHVQELYDKEGVS